MVWTAPTTRTTGELITASIWNTDIVNNLEILKDPPSDYYVGNEGVNWTTTSTSFVNADAALLSLSVTTTDVADLMVGLNANMQNGTGVTFLDISLNGVRQIGDDGAMSWALSNAPGVNASFVRWFWGLAANTYTINLMWKVSAGTANLYAGAGTANADVHPMFWAREVS